MVLQPPAATVYTTLLAADIVAFGGHVGDVDAQLHLRRGMYDLLEEAFALTRLPWERCRREDRGDGVVLLAPPDADPDAFLDPLAYHVAALLRRNRYAADHVRLRMRLSVHHSYVCLDDTGFAGAAAIHLFRLLHAHAFKRALSHSPTDLALIVSDRLYQDALQRGRLFDPGAYRRARVNAKETRTTGWIWLPPSTSADDH